MAIFKDSKGRDWELRIDAPAIMRIREDCEPQFLKDDFQDTAENTYTRLQSDPVLLCRVIYLLCDKERKARDVSEEDFYLGVIGDSIDVATEALLEAIVNFIPRRTRDLFTVLAKQDRMNQEMRRRAVEKISDAGLQAEVLAKMEQEIDAKVQSFVTVLRSASSGPASSESAPPDSPSAN